MMPTSRSYTQPLSLLLSLFFSLRRGSESQQKQQRLLAFLWLVVFGLSLLDTGRVQGQDGNAPTTPAAAENTPTPAPTPMPMPMPLDKPEMPPAPSTAGAAAKPSSKPAPMPRNSAGAVNEITFSFYDANWDVVFKWLAEITNKSLIQQGTPPGKFQYFDSRSYTLEEAIDIINSVLLTKGFITTRKEGFLYVLDLKDGLPANLVEQIPISELSKRGETEIVKVLLPLQGLAAETAKKDFQEIVGKYGSIIALTSTNQLLITDISKNVRQIVELVQAIEQGTERSDLKTFTLKYVSVLTAERIVREILGLQPKQASEPQQQQSDDPRERFRQMMMSRMMGGGDDGGRGRGRDGRSSTSSSSSSENGPFVSADDRTNTLIVKATPDKLAVVAEVIRTLDIENGEDQLNQIQTPQLEVYPVQSGSAAGLAQAMTALFGQSPETKIASDPDGGKLLVYATPRQHQEIAAFLEQVSIEDARIEVIGLRVLNAGDVALMIRALWEEEEDDRRSRGFSFLFGDRNDSQNTKEKPPFVEPDTLRNQLVVRGTQKQIDQIRALLRDLGETGLGNQDSAFAQRYRRIPLGGEDPEKLARDIQRLWKQVRPDSALNIEIIAPMSKPVTNRPNPNEDAQTNPAATNPANSTSPAGTSSAPASESSAQSGSERGGSSAREGRVISATGVSVRESASSSARDATESESRDSDRSRSRFGSRFGGSRFGSSRRSRDEDGDGAPEAIPPAPQAPTAASSRLSKFRPPVASPPAPWNQAQSATKTTTPGAAANPIVKRTVHSDTAVRLAAALRQLQDQESSGNASPNQGTKPPRTFEAPAVQEPEVVRPPTMETVPADPQKPAIVIGQDILITSDDPEQLELLDSLIASLVSQARNTNELRVYYLEVAEASATSSLVEDVLYGSSLSSTRPIRIVSDERTNSLIVIGPRAEQEKVQSLLEILDSTDTPDSALTALPRRVPLTYAGVEDVAIVVRDIFAKQLYVATNRQQGGEAVSATSGRSLTLGTDTQTNTLIIAAPKDLADQVEQLALALDNAASDNQRTARVINLSNAKPEAVKRALSTLFNVKIAAADSRRNRDAEQPQQPQQPGAPDQGGEENSGRNRSFPGADGSGRGFQGFPFGNFGGSGRSAGSGRSSRGSSRPSR